MKNTRLIFLLFFLSGFCGLLYQVVWVRLAFANFGIITPVLSVVISVFMLGLSIGSWAGGRWIGPLTKKTGHSAAIFYAGVEFFTALSSVAVPLLFVWFGNQLLALGESDSFEYLFYSALAIGISLFPWVFAMGTTFPIMLAYIREDESREKSGFSFLYLANVTGATFGVLLTALVLIEILGFTRTLYIGGTLNLLIGSLSITLAKKSRLPSSLTEKTPVQIPEPQQSHPPRDRLYTGTILFLSGFISLAMEVIWTRAFTPILETTIYAFASLLATYLFTTFLGTMLYRYHLKKKSVASRDLLVGMIALVLTFPILINDPAFSPGKLSVLISIFPLCALLGYLTPKLIDEYSAGEPAPAGFAYALNIVGSILGPLVAGYLLLPSLGVKISLLLLSLPFFAIMLERVIKMKILLKNTIIPALASLLLFTALSSKTFESGDIFDSKEVRRDYAATVISTGEKMGKRLLVNGVGITFLTPLTKLMAHLPMAIHENPERSLAICFGMGTTFRSLASWGSETTAVELIPSVKNAFSYYFDDTEELLKNPKNKIVVDDGRRFLKRTNESFDVITIDPPPPIEAAGSSLLYSEEFYQLLKKRLNKGGIVLQWFPGGEEEIFQAVARAAVNSFPHVKLFFPNALEDVIGKIFLLSMEPIRIPSVEKFVARMPETAKDDFMEWWREANLKEQVRRLLFTEVNIAPFLSPDKNWMISDDKPINEYFLLRRNLKKISGLSI
ncbi:MAG: fused MFS/spermidine synthase [Nitrospinota bacterium]